jgi:hypothetical protein
MSDKSMIEFYKDGDQLFAKNKWTDNGSHGL